MQITYIQFLPRELKVEFPRIRISQIHTKASPEEPQRSEIYLTIKNKVQFPKDANMSNRIKFVS